MSAHRCVLALLFAGCAGSRPAPGPPPASTPPAVAAQSPAPAVAESAAATSAPGSAAAAPPTAAPPPTGGSVLVGEIPGTKKFDPRPVVDANKAALVDCYNQARASRPDLAGKLKLSVVVNQAGSAVAVEAEPGGSANDARLVECLRGALQAVRFPKPGGMATVVVPLLFRP